MTKQNALLFFMKYPEPGKVKTRLAKTIGDEQAAKTYGHLIEENLDALSEIRAQDTDIIIVYDPVEKHHEIQKWLPAYDAYLAQQGSDLGQRLQNAFEWAFRAGYVYVMAFGSDTMGCRPKMILEGFEKLKEFNVVLGPAEDGGYYAIALKRKRPELFQNIPWSTDQVFETTLNEIKNNSLTYHLLPTLKDLDEIPVSNKEVV